MLPSAGFIRSVMETGFRQSHALQVMKLDHWCDTDEWTLFLDRDGTINRRIVGDYVKRPSEFEFLPGVKDALRRLRPIFKRMIVVTNQQGIGKRLMSEEDLEAVHERMEAELKNVNVTFDAILHCPGLAMEDPACRKPNRGMADQAVKLFPDISLYHSIMAGDSPSDIGFAKNAGMKSVLCGQADWRVLEHFKPLPELFCRDLAEFADVLERHLE